MDFEKTLDGNLGNLTINHEIKNYLTETAKWAKFLAIIGFAFMALMLMIAIGIIFFFSSIAEDIAPGQMGEMVGYLGFLYVGLAAIYFFPILYLYRFATNMKGALNSNDDKQLTDAFANLKSHYKFFGIFMAIIIGFYALMFVGSLIFGISSTLF